jgi:hypothetical protein
LGGDGQFREAEAETKRESKIACVSFAAASNDVLPRLSRAIEGHGIVFALGKFDHDDGISPRRDGGASHDLQAGAGGEGLGDGVASFDFPDAMESHSGMGFGGGDGIAIAGGAVERWVFAIGANFLGKDVAESIGNGKSDCWTNARVRFGLHDDELAGVGEREHAVIIVAHAEWGDL